MNNNMGLQNLLNEPQRLAIESDKLNDELDSLVLDNYRIFIENLTCSVHLRTEDKNLSDVSAELENNMKILSHQCLTFKDRIGSVVTSHKRNRKTLQHHLQLIELLEVPQLVDACVRNGFYDEALELANFVNGLERRHLLANVVKSFDGKLRGGSSVVKSIVNDVNKTLVELRQFLLHHFAEDTPLPVEIQTLSTLRKLDRMLIDRQLSLAGQRSEGTDELVLTDTLREERRARLVERSNARLQMDFLEARSMWLQKRLPSDSVGPANLLAVNRQLGPYGCVIELLETRRTAWFATVTQFATLFQLDLGTVTSGLQTQNDQRREYGGRAVLEAWILRQVEDLLRQLAVILPLISEGGSLRSILEQVLFFAHRMGQVGCDFTDLVLPLFKKVVVDRVAAELRSAGDNFRFIMQHERIDFDHEGNNSTASILKQSAGDLASRKEQLIPLYSDQNSVNHENLHAEGVTGVLHSAGAADEFTVPSTLMKFPPLTYLINCLTKTMNFVRECPIMSVRTDFRQAFLSLMQEVSEFLCTSASDISRAGSKYFLNNSAQLAVRHNQQSLSEMYAHAAAYDLFPYALLCLEAVFSANHSRILDRVGNYKLKHSLVPASRAATPAGPRPESAHLACTTSQAQELLGKFVAADLQTNCWRPLSNAALLGATE